MKPAAREIRLPASGRRVEPEWTTDFRRGFMRIGYELRDGHILLTQF